MLVRGPVSKLVLTSDLERAIALEGCLGGNVPAGRDAARRLGRAVRAAGARPSRPRSSSARARSSTSRSARSATSTTRSWRRSRRDAQKQYDAAYKLARRQGLLEGAAPRRWPRRPRQLASAQSLQRRDQARAQVRVLKAPKVNDPGFVSQLVFAGGKTAGTPKARFAYLFPNADSSLSRCGCKPGLSDAPAQGRDRPDPRRDRDAADCGCSTAGTTSSPARRSCSRT